MARTRKSAVHSATGYVLGCRCPVCTEANAERGAQARRGDGDTICDVCGRAFVGMNGLHSHAAKVHRDKPKPRVWEPTPVPVGDPDDWFTHAACRGLDPAIFFTLRGEDTSVAKALCRRCPVRRDCLEYALSVPERHGVWGGLSERERRRVRRIRRKARSAFTELREVS